MRGLNRSTVGIYAAVSFLALGALPGSGAAQGAKLDDATIVAIFDAANGWDVETGALATTQGKSKAVRDFGAMLAHDHKAVRQQGRDLAARLKVTPTPPSDFPLAKNH